MKLKNKKGQSTVEYILLVTAVVAVMIVFATSQNGGFQTQLNSTLNTAVGDIGVGMGVLTSSHIPGSPTGAATDENVYTVNVSP